MLLFIDGDVALGFDETVVVVMFVAGAVMLMMLALVFVLLAQFFMFV